MRPDDIPQEICEAADLVAHWFKEQGCDDWKLMGIQSRVGREEKPLPPKPAFQITRQTHNPNNITIYLDDGYAYTMRCHKGVDIIADMQRAVQTLGICPHQLKERILPYTHFRGMSWLNDVSQ